MLSNTLPTVGYAEMQIKTFYSLLSFEACGTESIHPVTGLFIAAEFLLGCKKTHAVLLCQKVVFRGEDAFHTQNAASIGFYISNTLQFSKDADGSNNPFGPLVCRIESPYRPGDWRTFTLPPEGAIVYSPRLRHTLLNSWERPAPAFRPFPA